MMLVRSMDLTATKAYLELVHESQTKVLSHQGRVSK